MRDFIERLKSSSVGKKIEQEATTQVWRERRALAQEYVDVARATDEIVRKLVPARDAAREEFLRTCDEREQARVFFIRLDDQIRDHKLSAASRRARLLAKLQQSADPAIAAAQSRLRRRLDDARRRATNDSIIDRSAIETVIIGRSTQNAIGRLTLKVRDACAQLEALKLRELGTELAAAIRAIEDAIDWSDLKNLEPPTAGPVRARDLPPAA